MRREAQRQPGRRQGAAPWFLCHERLLAPTCGPTVRGHAKELDRLSDLLGDDHDLAMLRQALTQGRTPVAVDLDAVINLIDHRRSELQLEATGIGERLYAETPKAFRRNAQILEGRAQIGPTRRRSSIRRNWPPRPASRPAR